MVSDGASITDVASINGSYTIESMVLANGSSEIENTSILEIDGFEVKLSGPNPFNPTTSLNVVVPMAGHVTVKIYNIIGQHVATLADEYMDRSASGHTLHWNAGQMPSGVYLVRAETASSVSTQKLMLLK